MGSNDAEMPSHQALSEEIQEIAKHLATLRREVEALTGQLNILSSGTRGMRTVVMVWEPCAPGAIAP